MAHIVFAIYAWEQAPEAFKAWIQSQYGAGPWAVLATVPDGKAVPRMIASRADESGKVIRSAPGGMVVAWPPPATGGES